MREVKDYCVLEEPSLNKLEQSVLQMIRQGWLPQGGIAVVGVGDGDFLYAQAMVLKVNAA